MEVEDVFIEANLRKLVTAALKGDAPGVGASVSSGAKVDSPGQGGLTPLLFALMKRNVRAMDILLAAGADPNLKVENGHSALSLASGMEDPALLKLLLSRGGDPKTFVGQRPATFVALGQGRLANVKALVSAGADINAKSPDGDTMALEAAYANEFDAVRQLLEAGADHTLTGSNGASVAWVTQRAAVPQGSAVARDRDAVIAILKKQGVVFPVSRPSPPVADS
jgi:ankyrin repeat protein